MKISKLLLVGFLIIMSFVFLIGGFTQFFIGVPNTVYTYFIIVLLFLLYFVYVFFGKKMFWDKVIVWHLIFALWILISAWVNDTPFTKWAIYSLFFLLPLGSYLFFKINKKKNFVSQRYLSRLYLTIAFLQLPLLLLQKVGYNLLIGFNQSGQAIAEHDFMFGSFFLKADHALGFFLLFNIINLVENNKKLKITNYPFLAFLYLSLTIFLTGSNISKVILLVLLIYLVYKSFPRKIRVLSLVLALLLTPLVLNLALRVDAVNTEAYFIKTQYNAEKSLINYEKGIAKRPQVLIAYATAIPFKWVGDGPYSYFDILTGKFQKTKHFSQIIWAYADLGIVGLIILIALIYNLVKNLDVSNDTAIFIFGIVLIFSLMTTIFSDLAIMITLTSLLQKNKTDK